MTVFDLLFIVLFIVAIFTLGAAVVAGFRGCGGHALNILRKLIVCATAYIAMVYIATAFSKPVVLHVGDPECSDDWCLAVDRVTLVPPGLRAGAVMHYDITLRIFSRARRVAQRENVARDVYLVNAEGTRYNPVLTGSEIPLNTLLQPGESVTTSRNFVLPAGSRGVGLMIDRSSVLPFCVIIGECGAFHKGTTIRID